MKRLGLILILIVGCAATGLAQSSAISNRQLLLTAEHTNEKFALSSQDDPIAKALEQAINRLAVAEQKLELKDAQLQAKDATIGALESTIKLRDEQLTLAKGAILDRTQVNNSDARMLVACENQLAKADARIHQLENPGFFKTLFDRRTLTGFGLGYGVKSVMK